MATVLIADDDTLVRMVLRMAIEQRGHRALEAGDTRSFLAQLAEADLCMMDAAMPGSPLGDRIAAALARPHPPSIVIMSGTIDPPEAVQQQGLRFLGKPIELSTLTQLLDELFPAPPKVRT
ncbi:MAG: response regulator [Naasia sp.]|jgi:two-component system OmpR family response regulator|uniref:response regulator n=1 Tax=Naasia sp. TaxID=2546198 RepID=UPI00260EE8AE|nr:response regulator [Naasia sp.]MCU1571712.1 response regulator [Naasia sp.]